MISHPSRAERTIAFMESLPQGRGPRAAELLELRDWQRSFVSSLMQPKIRRAGLWIPRKNGKSALGCGLAVNTFADERPEQGEIILAGPTIKQAGRLFDTCCYMLRKRYPNDWPKMGARGHSKLRFSVNRGTKEVTDQESGTKLFVLTGEGAGHGYGPSLVICDELHEWPAKSELWNALQTGFGDQTDGFAKMVTLTTIGVHDPEHMEQVEHDYATGVADGKVDDPTYLPLLYGADIDAEWDSERVWGECNPALDDYLSLDFLRTECNRAKNNSREQNRFRRLYLGQRTSAVSRWLNWDHWLNATGYAELGEEVFGGLDLSSKQDVTSLCFVSRVGGKWCVQPHFWIPEETAAAHEKEAGIGYKAWADGGYITLQPGHRINQGKLIEDVVELCRDVGCQHVACDEWSAAYVIERLGEHDIQAVELKQNARTYTPPGKELTAALADGEFEHPGNKVLDWMAGNVETKDVGDGFRPVKPKTALKIDGITALLMALSEAMEFKPVKAGGFF